MKNNWGKDHFFIAGLGCQKQRYLSAENGMTIEPRDEDTLWQNRERAEAGPSKEPLSYICFK
jgi:hypothetical protein